MDLVVAIDGVSGSGKSTAAKSLAVALGVDCLDTGAMYRAVAWLALQRDLEPADEVAVAELLAGFEVEVTPEQVVAVSPLLPAGPCDITHAIRTPAVTAAASEIAKNLAVRTRLQELQRAWIGVRGKGVVEGRDIGTVVFPEAKYKFFLTASAEARASRRAGDLGQQASDELPRLTQRDSNDSSRQHSPLRQATDAVVIDTTGRQAADTLKLLLQHFEPAWPVGRNSPESSGDSSGSDSSGSGSSGSDSSSSASSGHNSSSSDSSSLRSSSPRFNPHDFPAASRYGQKRSTANVLGYRVVRKLVVIAGVSYCRVRVKNRHKLPRSGPVIVAPGGHRSNLDTPFVGIAVTRTSQYMAKESLFKSSFWSAFIGWLGGFPVARDRLDLRALKLAQATLGRGEPLIVFPEGARQQGPELQPLYEGVAWLSAKTGAPVLPLGIGGSQRVMPIGVKWPRPYPVRMIFGDLLEPPGSKAKVGSERVPQAEERAAQAKERAAQAKERAARADRRVSRADRRVSRAELETFTQELSQRLQQLFDEAQQWAGTPNR